jgi:capsular polysaccharide biosynthesis protein
MKLPIPAEYLKLGAAAAIVGAVAAGAISFTLPRRYVSTAVMRFTPQAVPAGTAWQIEYWANGRLGYHLQDILSRSSLTEMIQRIGLDLYRQDLRFMDVTEDMRSDLRIERLPPRDFRISFEYPDRLKAQAVVRELTTRFNGPAEVLSPASLPEKPSRPDRLAIVAIGFCVGLASGILFAFLRRRGLKWTLRMAGCTAAGCALAAAVRLLMPDAFVDHQKTYQFLALGAFTGLVAGAFLLRARGTGGNRYARLIAFSAAFGAIAGGFVSFAIPERYVSTATMRAGGPRDAGIVTAERAAEYNERLRLITDEILSRGYLSALIQRPSFDLYPGERFRRPMEDIADDMRRRDLRIAPLDVTFQISFEYTDRDKAQAVVREVVDRYRGRFAWEEREFAKAHDGADRISGVPQLIVLDAASPASPVSPNRPAVAAIGLLAGTLLGSLLVLRRWLPARRAATPGPHVPYGKYTLAAAAIGALAFGLGSFVIPDRYVSTAVLRVVPFPAGDARTAPGEIEYTARLRQLTQDVLSRGCLAELIQRRWLDLYRPERQRRPLEDIIDDMRNRDIRIAATPPFGFAGPGRLTSFEISFEYPDRFKAQAVVRELVTKFIEGDVAAERALHRDRMPGSLKLEVLDAASDPQTPVSPNRPAAAAIGLLAGMLLGPFLAWRRQQRANRQAAGLRPRPSYWKYALPAAILGAISAASASFYIPNRYVSTAVLRLAGADPRSPDSVQAAAEHMPEMFRPVLSRDSLAEIIQRPTLQLYTQERARRSLDEVVKQMRERDLRMEPLRDSPFGGRPTAFRISFEYSDRAKGRACVQAVVSKFVEAVPLKHGAGLAPSAGPGHLHVSANGLLVGPAAELFANPYFPERDAAHLLDNKIVEGGGDGQPTPGAPYLEALDLSVYEGPVNFSVSEFAVTFPSWGHLGGLDGFPERDSAHLLDNKIFEGAGDGQPTPGAPYLEVLDLPSVSEAPVSFARAGALGGLAGLLLGIAIARARRYWADRP